MNCSIYEANPKTACSGCEKNLGWRPEDESDSIERYKDWINHILRIHERQSIVPISTRLTKDEVTGLLLMRSQLSEVQELIAELKRKDQQSGQESSH